jgi:hypothetical protein
MEVRLDLITEPGNLTDRVYEVIEWAEREGRLDELMAAVKFTSAEVALPSLATRLTDGNDAAQRFALVVKLLLGPQARSLVGYLPYFSSGPLSAEQRIEVETALASAVETMDARIKRLVVVTPDDLVSPIPGQEGDAAAWFETLRAKLGKKVALEHWGHTRLLELFRQQPPLCLLYYPELVPDGVARRNAIAETRVKYDEHLDEAYGRIQFVGMSVRTEDAARGVPLESIYIPLRLVPEGTDDTDGSVPRADPLTLLAPGQRHIFLGDPGSGKSTLLKFLALVGRRPDLQQRVKAPPDPDRLPVVVTLRRYADELKANPNRSLIDHIVDAAQGDYNLKAADLQFFEFYLATGRAILCFDGLDELPNPKFKQDVRDRVNSLLTTYPENTCLVTSRIVGYDQEFRFGGDFRHHKVAALQPADAEQFVRDWYTAREPSRRDREENIRHLTGVLNNPDQTAIRGLARNPLLLTIITLVHRIDSILPDVRVVLYRKCTETLLNTWHTWKHRDASDPTSRDRAERRNRERIEALAQWMHQQSVGTGLIQRAVVPHAAAVAFLTSHIGKERLASGRDPEKMAEQFLAFVRERAGLLMEVGDRQYSFVHLTFQEYLTATYLKRTTEPGGVEALWLAIAPHVRGDRWEETIRLLIAGLESVETRKALLDRLLAQGRKNPSVGVASLLLGCLLDRIEEAEWEAHDIAQVALAVLRRARKVANVSHLHARLREAVGRETLAAGSLIAAATGLAGRADAEGRRALAVSLAAVGVGSAELPPALVSRGKRANAGDAWIRALAGGGLPTDPTDLQHIQAGLATLGCDLAIASAGRDGSYLASLTTGIAFLFGPEAGEHYFVRHYLVLRKLYGYPVIRWPIVGYFRSIGLPGLEDATWPALVDWDRVGKKGVKRRRPLIEAQRQTVALRSIQGRAQDRVAGWYATRTGRRDWFGSPPHRRATSLADLLRTVPKSDRAPSRVWPTVLADDRAADAIAAQLIDSFGLSPQAHWIEWIRQGILPRMAATSYLDPGRVRDLIAGGAIDGKEDLAGCLLLLDAELWLLYHFDRPERSPLREIAERARASASAVLRLAGCVRDICYGDEKRIPDLVKMVMSPDRHMKTLLNECLWFPPDPNDPTQVSLLQRANAQLLQ